MQLFTELDETHFAKPLIQKMIANVPEDRVSLQAVMEELTSIATI